MNSGVYIITNSIDERVYIGSSVDILSRWAEHKRHLRNGVHRNAHLQKFANKYGLDSLTFEMLEHTEDTIKREQVYLDSYSNKFNVATSASAPMLGKKHTPEAKEKIRIRSTGKNNPMYGVKRPPELIEKLRIANRGRIQTHKAKVQCVINKPNRKEVKLNNGTDVIYCFSMSHAQSVLKVNISSIWKAMKKGSKCRGYFVTENKDSFYKKEILLKHINLFDEKYHPLPELINILKNL